MIHKLRFPQLPLSQFVENMWLVQDFEPGYTRERILPDGAIELIIDLATQPKSIFEDETSAAFRTVKKAWMFLCVFAPFASLRELRCTLKPR